MPEPPEAAYRAYAERGDRPAYEQPYFARGLT
jgi:hypothetical protein